MHLIETLLARELVEAGRVYSCGVYYPRQHKRHWRHEWSQVVWGCKHGNQEAIKAGALVIAQYLEFIIPTETPTVITFVPGDSNIADRSHSRSAAQALALAAYNSLNASQAWRWRHVSLQGLLCAARSKPRLQHQCTSRMQRRNNISGCFAVRNPELAFGISIVVIDDVLTSGATMRECQRVLLKAGAADVRGIVLARTVGW